MGHGTTMVALVKAASAEAMADHDRALYWAATVASRRGDWDWAAEAFDRVSANAVARGDMAFAWEAMRALAWLLNGGGRYAAANAVSQRLLEAVPADHRSDRAAVTLGYLITSMGATTEFREALRLIRALLPELATEPRTDSIAESYARCVAAVTLSMAGDFANARAEVERARVLVLGRDDDDIQMFVPWSLALVEFNAAQPDRADAAALIAEQLAQRCGDIQRILECRALRAATATMRGEVEAADRAFAELDQLRGGSADYWGVVLTVLSRPERLRLHGDLSGALSAAEANHALAASTGSGRFVCSTRLDIAYFKLLNGQRDAAREQALLALDEALALDAPLLIYGAHLMLAASSREHETASISEALRIAEERDYGFLMPYVVRLPELDAALWRALGTPRGPRSAVLLAATGPAGTRVLREAAAHLDDDAGLAAVGVLQRFGMDGIDGLRDLAAAARPRVQAAAAAALAGAGAANPHGLSRRESEVLQMLVQGRRTKEIAADLHLTPATVSTHIQHIMQKTGTGSRAELVARALRQLRTSP